MELLTFWDILLTPIYLLLLVALAKKHRNKRYVIGNPLRKYYMPGLYVKFGGAIFIALIYQFYYGSGGDTSNFFYHSKIINSALSDSVNTWFHLIRRASPDEHPEIYPYVSQMFWYYAESEYAVSVICAILGLVCGTTYLPIALLFAYISYTGIWAMYTTFVNLYPALHRNLAYAFLFIPSTFVWGSGVFKDTVCMFGLGWMTHTVFRIFRNKDFSSKNIILLVISFYLIALTKLYILMAFIPALSLWLMLSYSKRIPIPAVRWLMNLSFIFITILSFTYFTQYFAKELNKYSLEKIAKTAEVTRSWTAQESGDEGSRYDIGQIDGTLSGMLSMLPNGIIVSLFRPFPWEVRKVIIGLSAIEALFFLLITIKVFVFSRSKAYKRLFTDPNILFCFIFSIIFAFAVGVSSGNFGALSRYKIPCLPFYGAMLAILYTVKTQHDKNKIESYHKRKNHSLI